MNDKLERICENCNSFFPDTFEPTENGICLADEAFEPYLDDLLERGDFSACQKLIEVKRFHLQQEACPLYEEAEIVELPPGGALETLVENLLNCGLEDESCPASGYSFQDNSFTWLMEHDEGLRSLRREYAAISAHERRLAADYEYHAASADHLFQELSGDPPQPRAIPGEAVALAIDPGYAPAILTIGTHEHILGRKEEALDLLLDLVNLPEDAEDLVIIIDKAASFLLQRHDTDAALKLYYAACEKFPDEQEFRDGLALCVKISKTQS
ncbi:MAG: hypothetical protein WBW79_05945 [Desulfocapsaceae bacterium]